MSSSIVVYELGIAYPWKLVITIIVSLVAWTVVKPYLAALMYGEREYQQVEPVKRFVSEVLDAREAGDE